MRIAVILFSLFSFLAVACRTTQEVRTSGSGAQESVETLTVALVDLAARRVDLGTVRAAILPFRGAAPEARPLGVTPVAGSAPEGDLVGAELRREFELALANRLHLVQPDWSAAEPAPLDAARPAAPGAHGVASHVLLGDYAVRDGKLVLFVRLVDLESHLVLSAARSSLPLTWLSPRARAQLEPPATVRPPIVVTGVDARRSARRTVEEAEATLVAEGPGESASPAPTVLPPAPAPTERATAPPAGSARSAAAGGGTVEDFETWRARRLAESASPAPSSQPADSSTPPAPQPAHPPPAEKGNSGPTAPRASASPPRADVASTRFPWRENGKLANLLGIPAKERRRDQR